MRTIRNATARLLRRWAQRLSPVLTDKQIRDLRDYYDTHDSVTGKPIQQNRINIHTDATPEEFRAAYEAEKPRWSEMAKRLS